MAFYDFRDFHPDCPGGTELIGHGGRAFVVCRYCGVAGELEAISGKTDCSSIFLKRDKVTGKHPIRKLTGKLSSGHPAKVVQGGLE